jgi:parvulin-like peptidyl-prolyl isomerase
MRYRFVAFFLIFASPLFAQLTVKEQFEKLNSVADAQKWVDANQALKPSIYKLNYGKDSAHVDQRLLKLNKGEIMQVGYTTYKVLEASGTVKYRASYVFLDGAELSNTQIDSMKNIIVKKANAGTPFEQLSDQYTMDGNTTHGDTGWFFGEEMVPRELQDAVKNHKVGDIFFVDVSEKNWHYIVKKTYDDQVKKEVTVIKANGR